MQDALPFCLARILHRAYNSRVAIPYASGGFPHLTFHRALPLEA
jgi:hypothetical protein